MSFVFPIELPIEVETAGARIQIVEDERIVALDLKETLEDLGFHVTGMATRAEEAIRMAQEDRPDLVLMDIQLEGPMNGTQAAQRIRETTRIPVVFLTAFGDDSYTKAAARSAPYGYLLKPVETRELRATLTMALARRKAEVATERTGERLQLALEAGSMVAWEWAPGEFWVSNLPGEDPYGIAEVLALGKKALLERIHPDDRGLVEGDLLRAGSVIDAQVRLLSAGGLFRWVDLRARTYPDPLGDAIRIIGVASDVTAKREILDRLRHTEAAIETVGDGVVVLDAERRTISINSAFVSLTGYAREDVIGREPGDYLHARRQSDRFLPRLEDMAGGFWKADIACRRKSGGVFPAVQTVYAVTNGQGSVTNYVLSIADVSALRRAEAKIQHEARHDALTGLGNRRLMYERLDTELAKAQQLQLPLGVLFLDLDDFKTINDSLGHESGDIILQTVAERIEHGIRHDDVAIRVGGDEFLIVVPGHGRAECAGLAEKLLHKLAEPVPLNGEPVSITASIGIALHPLHGANTSDLAKAADNAMYEAKRNGRNGYAFYTDELAQRAQDRMVIEQGLRRGMARGEIRAHYQPIVRLADSRIVGFEALARWSHPSLGPIAPASFIPVAEDSGLIDEIGAIMLRQTCAEFMRWSALGVGEPALSVNVSVRQVLGADLVSRVQRILDETGFPAARQTLEMTESVLHKQDSSGRSVFERLKKIGVDIAIDDFGTGYSSLSLLNRLPIDAIKIDRSFVSALDSDPKAAAIIRAILAMTRSLDVTVIAEGVETSTQLSELLAQDCPFGQGFLFSPGVDGEQALQMARASLLPPRDGIGRFPA
jgi:diguanylate cyclase (GGDEF)-like protein/PAS domain S-box-containing protein